MEPGRQRSHTERTARMNLQTSKLLTQPREIQFIRFYSRWSIVTESGGGLLTLGWLQTRYPTHHSILLSRGATYYTYVLAIDTGGLAFETRQVLDFSTMSNSYFFALFFLFTCSCTFACVSYL